MARTSPAQYVRQVRQELRKVTWPSRKEVIYGTIMVFVMVAVMAIFFMLVDTSIEAVIKFILG